MRDPLVDHGPEQIHPAVSWVHSITIYRQGKHWAYRAKTTTAVTTAMSSKSKDVRSQNLLESLWLPADWPRTSRQSTPQK